MYMPSKLEETQPFKNDSLDGANLLPILPTFVRDARYQGEARYGK